jgi:alpha-tubulin suppressor-like RCC1 family protein
MKRVIVIALTLIGVFLLCGNVHAVDPMVAAGSSSTVALKSDGTVWAWGYNGYGQLGDGTSTDRSMPSPIPQLSDLSAIAGGKNHTIALKSDGTVWAWGYNGYGQLGDGTKSTKTTPVKVETIDDVIAIAGGVSHTVALKSDGTVWAWGANGEGQLGDGTTTNRLTPTAVLQLSGILAIAAGDYHTVALKSDGTVWAWGYNRYGQLGNGTTDTKDVPTQVWSGLNGITAVTAGENYTIALKSNGTVWAWGYNRYGQLGNGTQKTSSVPIPVPGLSGFSGIAAGESHAVALKSDGTVWTWGYNGSGQLGDGAQTGYSLVPILVPGLSGLSGIAAGKNHTIALKSDGTVWAWGYNRNGQLGNGTADTKAVATQVIDVYDSSGFLNLGSSLLPTPLNTWYEDFDNDGYGNPQKSISTSSQPSGYTDDNTDCDDTDSTIHPGATEIAGDGIDQDCDGKDTALSTKWYLDSDGDGYGDPAVSMDLDSQPVGYVADNTDCDDSEPTIHPGATEISGDGIDQDCDGKDSSLSTKWYLDSDGDGYGDPAVSMDIDSQPVSYVADNTDCDDADPTVHPGATEIAGDGIDQDCDGNDNISSVEQIYLLSPIDNKTMGFGSTTGQVSFSFSKISGVSKYILHLKMNDILNKIEFPISVELIPPGSGNNNLWGVTTPATAGFSETFMGMFYNLSLDQATWDAMSLYSIKWGVEAYNDSGVIIGSTYELSVPAKYGNDLKFMASSAIAMTSPTPGQELSKSNSSPTFLWDTYQGVSTYTFILAHLGSFGFDTIVDKPGLTLNISPMDDSAWQSMPTGSWYWTVLGYDSFGALTPQDFTIFDFEVKD